MFILARSRREESVLFEVAAVFPGPGCRGRCPAAMAARHETAARATAGWQPRTLQPLQAQRRRTT